MGLKRPCLLFKVPAMTRSISTRTKKNPKLVPGLRHPCAVRRNKVRIHSNSICSSNDKINFSMKASDGTTGKAAPDICF